MNEVNNEFESLMNNNNDQKDFLTRSLDNLVTSIDTSFVITMLISFTNACLRKENFYDANHQGFKWIVVGPASITHMTLSKFIRLTVETEIIRDCDNKDSTTNTNFCVQKGSMEAMFLKTSTGLTSGSFLSSIIHGEKDGFSNAAYSVISGVNNALYELSDGYDKSPTAQTYVKETLGENTAKIINFITTHSSMVFETTDSFLKGKGLDDLPTGAVTDIFAGLGIDTIHYISSAIASPLYMAISIYYESSNINDNFSRQKEDSHNQLSANLNKYDYIDTETSESLSGEQNQISYQDEL